MKQIQVKEKAKDKAIKCKDKIHYFTLDITIQ